MNLDVEFSVFSRTFSRAFGLSFFKLAKQNISGRVLFIVRQMGNAILILEREKWFKRQISLNDAVLKSI